MKLQDFDFRIWDNIEKKYCKSPHGLYIENTEHNDASSCRRIIENYEQLGFSVDHPYNCGNNEYFVNENAFSIELFTGLYDKNGKKVYEGDILRSGETFDDDEIEAFIDYVKFENGSFHIISCFDGEEAMLHDCDLSDMVIIGNIHENENLLNQGL